MKKLSLLAPFVLAAPLLVGGCSSESTPTTSEVPFSTFSVDGTTHYYFEHPAEDVGTCTQNGWTSASLTCVSAPATPK